MRSSVKSYDGEGNRLTRGSTSGSDGSREYQWDYRDRLEKVTFKNSSGVVTKTVTYQYDANDLRIAKFVDTDGDNDTDTSEWFVNDGQQVVFSHFQDAPPPVGPTYAVTHRYLHGPEVDQVFADDRSVGQILWGLADANSTVRDVAVFDGTTTTIPTNNHRVFDSFGNLQNPDTDGGFQDDFAIGFTGREYDADAQLSYHRARWYDPVVGRWISEDPLGFEAGDTNLSHRAKRGWSQTQTMYPTNTTARITPLTSTQRSGHRRLSCLTA